jgi:hypothetical protein
MRDRRITMILLKLGEFASSIHRKNIDHLVPRKLLLSFPVTCIDPPKPRFQPLET